MTEIICMVPAKNAKPLIFFSPCWFVTERCKCGYDVPIELGQEDGPCVACGATVSLKPPAAEP
jgi:hypothetical protein